MNDIKDIVLLIEMHHDDYPDHGTDCSCLDTYIQQARKLFAAKNKDAQCRVDYVLRSAIERR